MKGILFLVVGPSGAGKDTLMDGVRARLADDARFVFARRAITGLPTQVVKTTKPSISRNSNAAATPAASLLIGKPTTSYGLPIALEEQLASGKNVLANVSRAVIPEILTRYSSTKVVEITAPPEILAARLGTRTESEDDIKRRLARKAAPYPSEAEVLTIQNDSTPEAGIDRLHGALLRSLPNTLCIRQLPIDTWHENVCFLHRYSRYNAEDYLGTMKVDISGATHSIRSKVNVIDGDTILNPDEIGLSRHAFEALGLPSIRTLRSNTFTEERKRLAVEVEWHRAIPRRYAYGHSRYCRR